ncbi:MAG: cell division protein SepF [Methanomassiliicoccaceae archaeon]|nr:cell division protein SepF [Methanomassiliicoccaceae archaeon]
MTDGNGMAIIRKKDTGTVVEPKGFIDLTEYPLIVPEETDARVKIIEIRTFEDLSTASDLAYKGNILFIRCALPEENKKGAMDTITAELKRIAKDCGGDMVIIGDSFVLMTTNGVRIDNMISKRKKRI